jgi:hypothetical protein
MSGAIVKNAPSNRFLPIALMTREVPQLIRAKARTRKEQGPSSP